MYYTLTSTLHGSLRLENKPKRRTPIESRVVQKRPHLGLDNEIIEPPPEGKGEVVCREWLGELLKFYWKIA